MLLINRIRSEEFCKVLNCVGSFCLFSIFLWCWTQCLFLHTRIFLNQGLVLPPSAEWENCPMKASLTEVSVYPGQEVVDPGEDGWLLGHATSPAVLLPREAERANQWPPTTRVPAHQWRPGVTLRPNTELHTERPPTMHSSINHDDVQHITNPMCNSGRNLLCDA